MSEEPHDRRRDLFGSLEVTAILHELLRHHRVTVASGYRPRWDNTSLPVPADGLPLRLEPRPT